ncbi:MAG: hypothetical protein PHF00_14040 [Elusimicrobia bacterium]|nr:hypothetical protein [Elusimicrobiota bacterium]
MSLDSAKLLLCIVLAAGTAAAAKEPARPCSYFGDEGLVEHAACLLPGKKGAWSVAKKHLKRLDFSEGLAAVYNKELGWMYVDRKGRVLIKGVAVVDNGPDGFHDGLVRFTDSGKCGYANRAGKRVIRPDYDGCLDFQARVAKVCRGCRSECVDQRCEAHELKGGEWLCIGPSGRQVGCGR